VLAESQEFSVKNFAVSLDKRKTDAAENMNIQMILTIVYIEKINSPAENVLYNSKPIIIAIKILYNEVAILLHLRSESIAKQKNIPIVIWSIEIVPVFKIDDMIKRIQAEIVITIPYLTLAGSSLKLSFPLFIWTPINL